MNKMIQTERLRRRLFKKTNQYICEFGGLIDEIYIKTCRY